MYNDLQLTYDEYQVLIKIGSRYEYLKSQFLKFSVPLSVYQKK